MNKCILSFLFLISAISLCAADTTYSLISPDGKLEVILTTGKQLTYELKHNGAILVEKSAIGLQLMDKDLGKEASVSKRKTRSATENIVSPNYRSSSFSVSYNELDITFKGQYGIQLRAYNDGIAYRFYTSFKQPFIVKNETVEFNFKDDYTTYMAYTTADQGRDPYAMAFQNLYTKASLTSANPEKPAFLPITIDYANGTKLTITESDLEAYPGMFIRGDGKTTALKGEFAAYPARMDRYPWRHMTYVAERADYIAESKGTRRFPWRVFAVSEKDTEMPLNNLVYALASENRIGDYSWVKGGKVAWDWWNNWGIYDVDFEAGINMDTYKYYIDFASENGISYVILDEGWYSPSSGDMLTVIPELDLPELISYANNLNVDIILWTVFNVLDEQLEEACRKYSEMGVKGFKVDFIDRDDQTAVEMTYRIAEAAAKYKLTLNFHGFYKPTGLNRTFPNIINFESVFGMEEVKWSTVEKDMMNYDVIMPYIRMMAGPVDYTPGAMRNATKADFKDIYNNPMSQGTRCHQLATYIIHDSPITMLADNPTIYKKEQECTDFIVSIPNTGIEETRILDGKLGEYIVTARRVGNDWYVAGMTNWDKRRISLDLSFLEGKQYGATLFTDGANAHRQATDYKKKVYTAKPSDELVIDMAPGGGFALSLCEEKKETYIPKAAWRVNEDNDFNDPNSQFNIHRMMETPNVVAFWEPQFGDDPENCEDPKYNVPIRDIIDQADKMFCFFQDELKFSVKGSSINDKYRQILFFFYSDEGTVYGGSSDDMIGTMWINPNRVKKGPYGAIAHEMGHGFQSTVKYDKGHTFQGGSIYEMTSQYMLWQYYPDWIVFENYHLVGFLEKNHLAFLHQSNMYHTPFVLEYWASLHGNDIIGNLWHEVEGNEDIVMTYKRHANLSQKAFNDEMHKAYLRFMTWDMDRIRDVSAPYINLHKTKLEPVANGWLQIAKENCPQDYGYNGIELQAPEGGGEVILDFKGMVGLEGFDTYIPEKAGWRYGFMALKNNGERVYGETCSESKGQIKFTVPANTANLWLVVMGAPTEHAKLGSEIDEWPYQIKLTGTQPVLPVEVM